MPNFSDIETMKWDDVKPPPLLPVGTYLVGIIGVPERITSTQKQTPGYAFKYKFYQARDDVDRDALTLALSESNRALTDIEMTDTFYITENSAFMLKRYLEEVLEISTTGRSPKETLADVPGKQLLVTIQHRPRQDGSGLYADIRSRAKAN